MKPYICNICYSAFKTKEGLESHKKVLIRETGFSGLILKNKNKYFIFLKNEKVTRRHEELYSINQIYKKCVYGKVFGNVLKESSFKFTTSNLERKISLGGLLFLEELELLNLINYLDIINNERIYYSKKIKDYYSKIKPNSNP